MTNKFSQFSVSDSDFEAAVAAAVKTGKTPLTLESQSDEPFRMSVDFDRNSTMDSTGASTSADDAQKTGKNPLTLALNEQSDEPFQMTVDFERNATMDSSTDVSAEDVWFVFSTKQIDIHYLFPLQTNIFHSRRFVLTKISHRREIFLNNVLLLTLISPFLPSSGKTYCFV